MTRKAAPAKRRQRGHDVLPAGFVWRDGRPRWLPSPTRRAQGWSPVDLATQSGGEKVWMTQGEAIDRCKAINAAVKAWTLKSQPVPADMAAFAPPGSLDGSRPSPAQKLSGRAIGAMVDAWLASSKFTLARGQGGLADSTRADYRSKINILMQALVESEDDAKVQALRALPIDTLAVPEDEGDDFPLERAYEWLIAERGHTMAHGVLTVASIWLGWCWRKKRVKALAANPVELIEREAPAGKIRIATQEEIAALIASADALGLPSVAEAIMLALDLGWSRVDLLRFGRRRLARAVDPDTGREGWKITRQVRQKTGVVTADIFLMAIGEACVNRIIARQALSKVTPDLLLVREASPRNTSGVWTGRAFNDAFRQVREHAAQTVPSLLTGDGDPDSLHFGAFTFADTRDTFITLAREAELTVEQVCNRSTHASSERVLAVWRKAYGATTPRMAAAGARKLGAHLEATGWIKAMGLS